MSKDSCQSRRWILAQSVFFLSRDKGAPQAGYKKTKKKGNDNRKLSSAGRGAQIVMEEKPTPSRRRAATWLNPRQHITVFEGLLGWDKADQQRMWRAVTRCRHFWPGKGAHALLASDQELQTFLAVHLTCRTAHAQQHTGEAIRQKHGGRERGTGGLLLDCVADRRTVLRIKNFNNVCPRRLPAYLGARIGSRHH